MKYEKHNNEFLKKVAKKYLNSKMSLDELAEKYNVKRTTIYYHVRNIRMSEMTLSGGGNCQITPATDSNNNKIINYTPSKKDVRRQPSLKNTVVNTDTSDDKNVFTNERTQHMTDVDGKHKKIIRYNAQNAEELFNQYLK